MSECANTIAATMATPKPISLASRPNLFNYDEAALSAWLTQQGEANAIARARDVLKYLHGDVDLTIGNWQKLKAPLRQQLAAAFICRLPEIRRECISEDGTIKWLLGLSCGQSIETVYIPEGERGTVCVSSQVGCALNCQFCSTATQGFNRNLETAEIIGQLAFVKQRLRQLADYTKRRITNVVMMGMGEPLLNFDAVLKAMRIMLHDHAYNLSKYRVTLSTSGLVPRIYDLTQQLDIALAISLHAPDDALRDQLVPINRKYPLAQLLAACQNYCEQYPKRSITIEYVMLAGVNDSVEQANALANLLQAIKVKINLIPFNPYPGTRYQCSDDAQIQAFQAALIAHGYNTIVRRTRGDDIAAACGQLVGNVLDRTRRTRENN